MIVTILLEQQQHIQTAREATTANRPIRKLHQRITTDVVRTWGFSISQILIILYLLWHYAETVKYVIYSMLPFN